MAKIFVYFLLEIFIYKCDNVITEPLKHKILSPKVNVLNIFFKSIVMEFSVKMWYSGQQIQAENFFVFCCFFFTVFDPEDRWGMEIFSMNYSTEMVIAFLVTQQRNFECF